MPLLDFKAPCPFCYTEIDLRAVHFRCLGRPAPGCQPCAKTVDTVRSKQFGDLHEYYPAFSSSKRGVSVPRRAECPHCHEDTGVRLCQQCHSRLPDGFSPHSPLFGLVGARSSGKTVMLAVMTQELGVNGPVQRRFGHAISPSESNDGGGQAQEFSKVLDQMKSGDGQLPAQTQQTSHALPIVFEWKKPGNWMGKLHGEEYVPTVFSFYDTAGEDLASTDRAMSMTYLLATDGVILLLDPFSFPGNTGRQQASAQQKIETAPEKVLGAVTETLRQGERTKPGKKVKQPVAVVISKIDAFFDQVPQTDPIRKPSSKLPFFDEEESKSVHDHIGALVANWGGDGLLRQLDMNYSNYRLFGLSALGAEPNYATHQVDQRGVLPHRVSEPLLWLMAERGFLPKKA